MNAAHEKWPTPSDNITMRTNLRTREYAQVCIYEVGREQGFPWKQNFRGKRWEEYIYPYDMKKGRHVTARCHGPEARWHWQEATASRIDLSSATKKKSKIGEGEEDGDGEDGEEGGQEE